MAWARTLIGLHGRGTVLVGVAAGLFGVLTISPGNALAQTEHTWTGDSSNVFQDPGNWDPAGHPQDPDTAVFDLPGPHLVEFFDLTLNQQVRVHQGDYTFDLDSHEYHLLAPPPDAGLIVGDASGGEASLTLRNGLVQTQVGEIAREAGATGTVLVEADADAAQLHAEDRLDIGVADAGHLLVDADGQAAGASSAGDINLGLESGSLGTAEVSGPQASLMADQTLRVGGQGQGTLVIHDGRVTARQTLEIGEQGTVDFHGGRLMVDDYIRDAGGTFNYTGGTLVLAGERELHADAMIQDVYDDPTRLEEGFGLELSGGGLLDADYTVDGGELGGHSLVVGQAEEASLSIENGGTASFSLGMVLGTGPYDDDGDTVFPEVSSGTVDVIGGDSSLDAGELLMVGWSGEGTLNVLQGASVTSGESAIGNLELAEGHRGEGHVHVAGGGSTWTLTDELHVGAQADGLLTIDNGGKVEADSVQTLVASHDEGDGTIRVEGSESTLETGSFFSIGQSGVGRLEILEGGTVDSLAGGATLGEAEEAEGDALVEGTQSLWQVGETLTVGDGGEGELSIDDGGRVEVSSGGVSGLGMGETGHGTATVGEQSVWESGQMLTVGGSGEGTLTIEDGGRVSTLQFAVLGLSEGGHGTATVDGPGSVWEAGQSLAVGSFGEGHMSVSDGGAVETEALEVGLNEVGGVPGSMTITGEDSRLTLLEPNNGNDQPNLGIGVIGEGSMEVAEGATVENRDDEHGATRLGFAPNSEGELHVHGQGTTFDAGQELVIGDEGYGELELNDGAAMDSGQTTLGLEPDGHGVVQVGTAEQGEPASWDIDGELVIGDQGTGEMTIDQGRVTMSERLTLGQQAGSSGTLTVSGRGIENRPSLSDGSQFVDVGYEGSGGVLVENDGWLDTWGVWLGVQSSGFGAITVRGEEAQWRMSQNLSIGHRGGGVMFVEDGGYVSSRGSESRLGGFDEEAEGLAVVRGEGSQWDVDSDLTVGYQGSGELRIEDGGRVDVAEWLTVGDHKDGHLEITDGGRLSTGSMATIRAGEGLTSTAIVRGEGSRWDAGAVEFGRLSGDGALLIEDGGELHSSVGTLGDVGGGSGAGTATVRGEGSLWDLSGSHMRISGWGDGTLNVENGGQVFSRIGSISYNSSGQGEVTLVGEGSRWEVSDTLGVGGRPTSARGEGELTVLPGATMYVGEKLKIWEEGTVNLTGGKIRFDEYDRETDGAFNFTAGTVQLGGDRFIGMDMDQTISELFGPGEQHFEGTHNMLVEGTAYLMDDVTLAGGLFGAGDINDDVGTFTFEHGTFRAMDTMLVGVGGPLGSDIELTEDQHVQTPEGAEIAAGGTVSVEHHASFGGGDINNAGEITLDGDLARLQGRTLSNAGLLQGHGRVDIALMNTADGEVRVKQGERLVITDVHTNAGEVNLLQGQIEFNQGMVNEGRLTMTEGDSHVFGDILNDDGDIRVLDESTGRFYGDLVNNGQMFVNDGSRAVITGDVSGDGSFPGAGEIELAGSLSPGNSPGSLEFGGDLLLNNAEVFMELAGTTLGEQYDHVDVANLLEVSGSLEVALLDDFAPTLGDEFNLFDFGELTGTFDDVLLPELSDELVWDDSNLHTTGQLSVIPEPGSLALLSAGGLLLMRRRRG